MRSDDVQVSLSNVAPVLDMIEKTTKYIGYDESYGQKMRLLGEELIQSCAQVLDELTGIVWLDTDEQNMHIHLKLEGTLSDSKRQKLIEISKSGRNEPPKGLFKRIGAFFETAFMSDVEGYVPAWVNSEYAGGQYPAFSMMELYCEDMRNFGNKNTKADELQGIESTILKNLADDITVAARASTAELVVTKKLPQ